MDIVVKTHIPWRNRIDPNYLDEVAVALVKAAYPDVEEVGIVEGSPTADGVNAVQIRAPMDEMTKIQIEEALKRIFNEDFEVSFGDTSPPLNRGQYIYEAANALI